MFDLLVEKEDRWQAYLETEIDLTDEIALELSGLLDRAEGGTLFGLPPDSNCQLQYYRKDVLEEHGFDGPAETWDEAIEIAKMLAETGTKQTGTWFDSRAAVPWSAPTSCP